MKPDIVVVGASAGGVEALKTLVSGLPADFQAPVFVVIHLPAGARSVLPEILAHAGRLPAAAAHDDGEIESGHIYVAPPDHHLLLHHDRMYLSCGPREHLSRPSVDALFRSAARAYGPRLVAVVLTGQLNDGTEGLAAVKREGGVAVVQDPTTAQYPSMPQSALDYVDVDHSVPLREIAPLLVRLTSSGVTAENSEVELKPARSRHDALE